jgi:dTDP-4-dehydrorhamnose reductase
VKALITGGTGFVGSNIVRVFAESHGVEVLVPTHSFVPGEVPYRHEPCDLTDRAAVAGLVKRFRPDVVVHAAILNDFARLYRDREGSWSSYVGATRNVVAAANSVGAKVIFVSTDWVFDGTQSRASETTPPNPVNLYGVMKMAGELVVTEGARNGAVARISGVNGLHRERPASPRAQDPGFGYFVVSIVDSLRAGERFRVWEADDINMVATPSLATESAEMMWRIADLDRTGIFHCCGRDSVSRRELAFATCDAFDLGRSLLDFGPPDADSMPGAPIPYDTSLDATSTAVALDYELPALAELLARFRTEYESSMSTTEG